MFEKLLRVSERNSLRIFLRRGIFRTYFNHFAFIPLFVLYSKTHVEIQMDKYKSGYVSTLNEKKNKKDKKKHKLTNVSVDDFPRISTGYEYTQ